MLPEFKSFGKIEHLSKLKISITQKIHGSNGQIYVYEKEDGTLDAIAGSRTRWLRVGDDNFGFAAFVEKNKEALIKFLGNGRHFGEWAGPGINNGEGLKEKTFVLFQWEHFIDRLPMTFPPNVMCVPLLFSNTRGGYQLIMPSGITQTVNEYLNKLISCIMQNLKNYGSYLVRDYLKPEGIVIDINGMKFKKVFNEEETGWKKTEKVRKEYAPGIDVSHLLQELRLEKLLSRDERYIREYPRSLKYICSDYMKDVEEEVFLEVPEGDVKDIKKALGRKIFIFVKEYVEKK